MLKSIILSVLSCFFSFITTQKTSVIQKHHQDEDVIQFDDDSYNISNLNDIEGSFEDTKTFSFVVESFYDVKVMGDGFDYYSSVLEKKIFLTYSNIADEIVSTIKFIFENEETTSIDLYIKKSFDNKYYYSFLSKDSLLRYMGLTIDDNWDNDELEAEYVSSEFFSSNNLKKVLRASSSNENIAIVYGNIKWTNSKNYEFPLNGMKIKIETSVKNYETYTNEDGYFIFYLIDSTESFNPFTDVNIHIYAKSEATSVIYDETTLYEKCFSNIDVTQDEPYVLNYTFTPENDLGKAMQIAQAAKYYSDYIKLLNNDVAIADCKFNYPNDPAKGCYYTKKTSIVHITSKQTSGEDYPESYESWDTIGHEYGHHIQYLFDIANNPGGKHSSNKNDADIKVEEANSNPTKESKDEGLRLAWGESWPTYFAITAQQTFPDDIRNDIYTVADAAYTSYSVRTYSLDSYENDGILGEGCERAIMRFLYKLYSSTTDDIDKFSLGDKTLWNIVISTQPHYFYQFVSALYSDYSKSDLGLLLEAYGMSAANLTITNIATSSISPTFSWSAQGGSIYFPNDLFTLSFYNQSKEKITEISNLTSNEYSLTLKEWSSILHSYGTKYYVMITSYANSYLSTGPYYSTFYEFTKPTNSLELISSVKISHSTRYYEKTYDILPNSETTLNVSFENSGYNVLQTFGSSDVYMSLYSADGSTLLASDDDSGYATNAWIYQYLNASTTYVIKIRSYNSNYSSKTKLTITPAHNFLSTLESALDSYDSIWNISNTTNYTLLAYGEQYYSEMLTFTPNKTGTYTISLTSEFDNYLYVIDPQSSLEITKNIDYNDDSDGTNASLTKSLTVGVTYFIVFSQYNPSDAMENLDEYDNCYIHIYLN